MPSPLPLTLAEIIFDEVKGQHLNLPVEWETDIANLQSQSSWDDRQVASKELLPKIYREIHKCQEASSPMAALCLSGGGIRSATFNLGILQGLARHKLLERFSYLSTVSGGGFIGGWLSAWMHRAGGDRQSLGHQRELDFSVAGVRKVSKELAQAATDPLSPEPDAIYNLRVYSNYLTPKKGLLSVDTWNLVAVYLRNLWLNWLVFLPPIIAFLMLPRLSVVLAKTQHLGATASLIIGFLFGAVALIYIGLDLPSTRFRNYGPVKFVIFCLVPLVISAFGLTSYWSRIKDAPDKWSFVLFSLALSAIPLVLFFIIKAVVTRKLKPQSTGAGNKQESWASVMLKRVGALVLILVAFALTSLIVWFIVTNKLPFPLNLEQSWARAYATFAVPSLLLVMSFGGTLIAGFTSRFTDAEDQEWWARAGAWIGIVIGGWIVFHLLVLFGPSLFFDLQTQLLDKKNWNLKTLGSVKGGATAVIGVVSGAITLFGGFSSKTPAHGAKNGDGGSKTKSMLLIKVAGVVFAAFIAILLSLVSDWLLASSVGNWISQQITGSAPLLNSVEPRDIVYHSPGRLILVVLGIFALIGFLFGLVINTNRFSLHYYWRNRIMRAYLGASNNKSNDTKDEPTDLGASNKKSNDTKEELTDLGASNKNSNDTKEDLTDLGASNKKSHDTKDEVTDLGASNKSTDTKNKFTEFDQSDNLKMHELKNQRPLHLLNLTLNLVGGKRLEWQDRKAESFSVSPLHAGSFWLGYRRSEDYGRGISLATAVAISGAAASPNMGYMMTSSIVRFIMTIFNIRLGFWLGNPGPAGGGDPDALVDPPYKSDSPTQSVRPIVSEALGMTDGDSPYVYLSDGGHFENLGLYEMVLRRCRLIVVSDASTDTNYNFDSLAMAIRQIRTDFGVPIDMEEMKFGNDSEPANNYCAIGKIRYSCVDNQSDDSTNDHFYDGTLIYIKPSLLGDEPRDVLTYQSANPLFPEEPIADQWFSESQFESYRALGSHMIEMICKHRPDETQVSPLDYFVLQGRAHVSRNRAAVKIE
jgi:hypothetical protein